jgi:cystine transport system substrate-binding protein
LAIKASPKEVHPLKKFVSSAIALMLIAAQIGCGSNNSPKAGVSASPSGTATGEITIGTELTLHSGHDKNGTLTGFDVELAEEVSRLMDMTPRFIETSGMG